MSYLSKIETGKAEPSEEILQHLLDRLGLKPDQETERKAAELADQCWELLLDGRREKLAELLKNIDVEQYRAVPAWMDLTLLSFEAPLDAALEPCMDTGSWPCSGSFRERRRKRRVSCQMPLPSYRWASRTIMPETILLPWIICRPPMNWQAGTALQESCWRQSSSSATPTATVRTCSTWSVTIRLESGWRKIYRMSGLCA